MNIFRFELRQGWKTAVLWALAMAAIAALYISIFPSLSSDAASSEVIKNFPAIFRKALNLSGDYLTFFPALYTVVLTVVVLAGSVQAMNLGVGIISKEVRNQTADFLLTKPIGRTSIQAQKLLAATVLILLTNVIWLGLIWGLIKAVITDPFAFGTFLASSSVLIVTQSFFLAIGYLLGSALPKVKSVIAVSLPVVFGFYVLGLLDTVIGQNKIKYLTPFKFFNVGDLTAGHPYESGSLIYAAVLIVIAVVASFVVYRRRDIHTV